MNQRIIYEKPEGGVAILIPAPECLAMHTIEEIAAKDVPAGLPYKIINASDMPADRTFRDAWEADIVEPDGLGAESNEFQEVVQ
jgi:hypothetical protein